MCREYTFHMSVTPDRENVLNHSKLWGEKQSLITTGNGLFVHLIDPSSMPPLSETHPKDSISLFIKYISFRPQSTHNG